MGGHGHAALIIWGRSRSGRKDTRDTLANSTYLMIIRWGEQFGIYIKHLSPDGCAVGTQRGGWWAVWWDALSGRSLTHATLQAPGSGGKRQRAKRGLELHGFPSMSGRARGMVAQKRESETQAGCIPPRFLSGPYLFPHPIHFYPFVRSASFSDPTPPTARRQLSHS